MDVKISVTTKCNAHCRTCPVWKYPGEDMSVDNFVLMWGKLMEAPQVHRILLNNTGDLYNHPDHVGILKYVESHLGKPVIMTTNAELMDYVPRIHELIISFNGGNKEGYEFTTGLPFERVFVNIRQHYEELKKVGNLEMHVLIWDGNAASEADILHTWKDFPGRIRVSYKYDNQMAEDHTLQPFKRNERVYCDYLDVLSIWPNGQIISCAHDFKGETNWGNIFTDSAESIIQHPERRKKQTEHILEQYTGLCEHCNYNTPIWGKFEYLR